MKRLLIVEDDPAVGHGLKETLGKEGYDVTLCADGEKGAALGLKNKFDIIILDIMLPSKSGIDVCHELRSARVAVPILMLTSRTDESDKVLGLEMGADDYLTKPFSSNELRARLRALLRRTGPAARETPPVYQFGDIVVDVKKKEITKKKQPLKISAREYKVLQFFIEHEGEVITRDMLLDSVWGYDTYPTTRTVDNYILSLRKLIEHDPAEPRHLITVHTAGYKFVRQPKK